MVNQKPNRALKNNKKGTTKARQTATVVMPPPAETKEELVRRNQGMISDMKALLGGDEGRFGQFKRMSAGDYTLPLLKL